ncbi:nickel ABC transporter substrate-binding protein [Paenibacillus sp. SYP-B4298]|uniref:nickel ABC transporter substrate-binding protein n=1 Tax=Paenibacillus sp. SYP-B4298 TaxID=2996034 RepID=UPI0022DE8F30|nr:nickel ABC transporter substrate-binding protein [Paenibacillus sp. SYP-B4298]
MKRIRKQAHGKRKASWLILLAMVLCLSACSGNAGTGDANTASRTAGEGNGAGSATPDKQPTDKQKSLTIIHSLPVDTLDPHNGWIALRAGVTETLVKLDENMKIVPWLASKWEARDELTWVFTLRDDVSFSDGTKLDADAAKASFARGIVDSKSLEAALKLASIEANGQELIFTTTEPHPAFPNELVHPTASLMSVAAEQAMGKDAFNMAPVGTGAFKVTGFTPGKELNLVRNEQYWDEPAPISEVKFQFNSDANVRTLAFQSKQADIVYHLAPEALQAIGQDEQLEVQSVTSLRTHYFTYNPLSDQVQDLRVRQALDKLIDREAIVRDIMQGHALAASGPFSPKLPFGSVEEPQQLDQAGALALLESAGYMKGAGGKLEKNGKPLKLKLIAFTGINPELPLMPLLVQSEATKAGITIEIVSVEYPETYIKETSDWDISTASYLTAPRGDSGSFLNSTYLPGGSYNSANIEVPGLEPIVKELNGIGDMEERIKLTREAVKTNNEYRPHSYLIHPNILVGMNKRVTNWRPGAEEFYIVTNKLDVD